MIELGPEGNHHIFKARVKRQPLSIKSIDKGCVIQFG